MTWLQSMFGCRTFLLSMSIFSYCNILQLALDQQYYLEILRHTLRTEEVDNLRYPCATSPLLSCQVREET